MPCPVQIIKLLSQGKMNLTQLAKGYWFLPWEVQVIFWLVFLHFVNQV